MASIANRALFFTTSPRTPEKMIPEIKLLHEQFGGCRWNRATQEKFTSALAKSEFFEGCGSGKLSDFSARDRINRAPKALGFVALQPAVTLTAPGEELIYGKRPQDIFLRQLLKFQLPSPYHTEAPQIRGTFCIHPYLEILRLIRVLNYLTFDEVKIFVMQMTDYHRFDEIVQKILHFRSEKSKYTGSYKRFAFDQWMEAIAEIYAEDIRSGRTRTRQSKDESPEKFFKTKASNLRDYADACFRYLRFTGLVTVSYKGHSLSIPEEKHTEVDYLLETVNREPIYEGYQEYLFHPHKPELYVDRRDNAIASVLNVSSYSLEELHDRSVEELKDLREEIVLKNRAEFLKSQVQNIKSFSQYSDIVDTYHSIIAKDVYDAPLIMEWNTWRAMTMLNGGNVRGNFILDDYGNPLSTAPGNMPDIECDYGDFALSVEVTLQTGQRQFESENESVARHCGQLSLRSGKDTYCLFVAQRVNPAALAHFFALHHMNISYYGGQAKIVPLDLAQFMMLIDHAYNFSGNPEHGHVMDFLQDACQCAMTAGNEVEWSDQIDTCVHRWLS